MYAVISYLGCFMGPPTHPLTREVMGIFREKDKANEHLQELHKSRKHTHTHLAVVRIKEENQKIVFFFDEQSW